MPCKYAQNVIILKQIWSNWQTWQENFVLSFFFFFITDLSIHLLSSLNLFILSVRKLVISYYFASLFPSPIGMWLVHFYLTFSVSVHIVWKCLIFLLCVYFFFVCVCVRVCVSNKFILRLAPKTSFQTPQIWGGRKFIQP